MLIVLCLIAGGAILSPVQAHATSTQANWVQAGFDRQRDGYNPFEYQITPSNVASLHQVWQLAYGSAQIAAPVEVNGVLYFGEGGDMQAVQASTGNPLWSRGWNACMCVSPVVVNGIVYAASGNSTLYAMKATNGTLLWSYTTKGGLLVSPLWANGTIYVASSDGNLYALNSTTGKLLWQFAAGGLLAGTLATDNGIVYLSASNSGVLYAVNATTGKLVWTYPTNFAAIVANKLVYVVGYTSMSALNESTGKLVWSRSISGPANTIAGAAVANGILYVEGSFGPALYALNASTGTLVWSTGTIGLNYWDGTPTIANGVLYVGGEGYDPTSSEMRAYNAATGALLWYADDTAGVNAVAPIVVNGMLFFASYGDSAMQAYHL